MALTNLLRKFQLQQEVLLCGLYAPERNQSMI